MIFPQWFLPLSFSIFADWSLHVNNIYGMWGSSTGFGKTEECVSSKGGNQIAENVQLTVDVFEKIVTRVDLSNIEQIPKAWKSWNFGEFWKLYTCEN